jgi:hypothetical protein
VTMTQRSRNPHRRRPGMAVVAVVALALAGAAAACGGDDDDDTAAADGEATETTAAAGAEAGDTAAFCDARVQLEEEFNADEPDAEAVATLAGDLQAAAPDDLAGNAEALAGILTTAAESGSDPTEDPAFTENIQPIDEVALAECGYEVVEVTAVDYRFDGLPETLEAGTVGFKMTNEGAEPHVMLLFRYNDGDTTTLDELLAMPEDEAGQHVTMAGAAFAEPGEWGAGFAELEPGRYAAVCPIPMGGTDSGPPHFMEGMATEFEVA